jgi:hypothetical protein
VIEARWNEDEGKWHFKIEGPNGVFEDQADIFCNGSGILNNWKWSVKMFDLLFFPPSEHLLNRLLLNNRPKIEGLHSFKGNLLHSASFDRSVDLKGKTVALIGTGSTGVQIVPALQPIVKKLIPFIRSPVWVRLFRRLDFCLVG